ncbi:uncharacterized protein [Halyomorpha halys]|uniref:uncharacterized protein n=1 Tax=Halyomorpha halys TaxID=286706 RepID=UPI0006D4F487|nr:uncharacterized protein LOC106685432 [Halyomorpha halys]XP_024214661.1 uncharacterized protein LOC106685432 [Halyomorpha halys]
MYHIEAICLVLMAGGSLAAPTDREAKSLAYFTQSYIDSPPVLLDGVPQEYTDYDDQLDGPEFPAGEGNEILSRARPSRPKPDSPVYYIRLPPAPYVLVPGVGYVSRPPTLRPPPVVQPRPTSFINLPVKFVSNGKPTGVYTWKPDSPVTHLDKGPYVFNGRPSDIFLLRNTYNALYEDALQNFYP